MAALTRAVQNARPSTRSELTGRVVKVLGPHCAALLAERTGSGDTLDEEVVLHGPEGWTRDLCAGQSVHAVGEWAEIDWRAWSTRERSRFLGVPDRLQFRVNTADVHGIPVPRAA